MGRVDGKVAVITGGSRGMGAEHARALVAEGAKVVIGDILDDEGKQLAAELGDAARYVHLDVTSPEDWQAAVATAVDEYGKVNVLVNNAGIVNGSTIQKFRLDKWKQILDVNLTGTFLGIQAVADLMIDAGGGRSSTCPRSKGYAGVLGARLCRHQVGCAWPGEIRCTGTGSAQRAGELHPPRSHPHTDDRGDSGGHGHRADGQGGRIERGVDLRGVPRQRRIVLRHRCRVRDGRRAQRRRAAQVKPHTSTTIPMSSTSV